MSDWIRVSTCKIRSFLVGIQRISRNRVMFFESFTLITSISFVFFLIFAFHLPITKKVYFQKWVYFQLLWGLLTINQTSITVPQGLWLPKKWEQISCQIRIQINPYRSILHISNHIRISQRMGKQVRFYLHFFQKGHHICFSISDRDVFCRLNIPFGHWENQRKMFTSFCVIETLKTDTNAINETTVYVTYITLFIVFVFQTKVRVMRQKTILSHLKGSCPLPLQ